MNKYSRKHGRNVVFLLVDALRADKCFDADKTAKTPVIDGMREKGTVFSQAISVATTTTPCVASILTGLYPFEHGVRSLLGVKLDKKHSTLAGIFRKNGYNTYAEVTGPLLPQIGLNRGFDSYVCRGKDENVYSTWGDNLIKKFKSRSFKEPYFIFIHFWELHHPRSVQAQFDEDHFGKNRYERALSSLDNYLGKLLQHFEEDSIIILHADHGEAIMEAKSVSLTNNLRDLYSKVKKRTGLKTRASLFKIGHIFHVYEYLVRVPLILVGKGLFPEGKVISDQVSQIDVLPTLVEALGLDNGSRKITGRSLMPLVNEEKLPEIPVLMEACGKSLKNKRMWLRGIRTPRFKFVHGPYNDEIKEELYDLKKDPDERKNIVKQKPLIAQKMKSELDKIYREFDEKEKIVNRIENLKMKRLI